MLQSQKVAIAAHLHVLLRRKTGRVTDTEWMAVNEAYAAEIIRFARNSAKHDGHTDLAAWADKLEAAVLPQNRAAAAAASQVPGKVTPAAPTGAPEIARYVRGIR